MYFWILKFLVSFDLWLTIFVIFMFQLLLQFGPQIFQNIRLINNLNLAWLNVA